eukprot:TRINITY_DN6054_c0_g1_i1.p1 TRINITY_DN6054_c0_g1~~TRINITY_DN6054_c0_g1_i1.p1  ORF type:complete len:192 (+),score=64.06 TRINITY_DN6054_c0_g1_i1:42-617(+)
MLRSLVGSEMCIRDRSELRKIGLQEMLSEASKIIATNKTPFFIDTTGNAAVFYKYKGTLIEFGPIIVQHRMGKKSKEEVTEELRLGLKAAVPAGSALAIHIDKTTVDLREFNHDAYFPFDKVFEPKAFAVESVYSKILKPGEIEEPLFKALSGFRMKDTFEVVIVSEAEESDIPTLRTKYPATKFEFVMIQ